MVKKIIERKKKKWKKCQTWYKTKATYKNSKIGDNVVDLMFEKTFFCFLFSCVRATLFQCGSSFFLFSCVRDTLFQPSGSCFFLFSCVRDTLDTLFQPSGSSFFLFSFFLCQTHFVSTKWESLFFVFFSLCVELLKN